MLRGVRLTWHMSRSPRRQDGTGTAGASAPVMALLPARTARINMMRGILREHGLSSVWCLERAEIRGG